MRILIIILAIGIFYSCTSEKKVDEKRIKRFENLLGIQDSKYLNEIITDFDFYLDNKYGFIKKRNRFERYLTDYVEHEEFNYFKIDSANLTKYKASNLFNKYFLEYPDSVWKDSSGFKVLYKSYGEPIIAFEEKTRIKLSETEFIEELKKRTIRSYISISPFYATLDSIKESDSLIEHYLWAREGAGAGRLSPIIIADGILLNLNDSSDYFAKRIFIMGIYDY